MRINHQGRIFIFFVCVGLVIAGVFAGAAWLRQKMYLDMKTQMVTEANLAMFASVEHTMLIVNQVDALLHAVRLHYLGTHSVEATDQFIDGLNFDKMVIDNIYLIGSDGRLLISHTVAPPTMVLDRDYFVFHQTTPADQMYISSVDIGRLTQEIHFCITRRVDNPDGSFGGVVLATVNPDAFIHFYQQLNLGPQSVYAMLGTLDRKLRARIPAPDPTIWDKPVESPLWGELTDAPAGTYENLSFVDHIQRTFMFEKVGDIPLVVLVGFSAMDIQNRVARETGWLTLAEALSLGLILTFSSGIGVVYTSREKLSKNNLKLNGLLEQVRALALYDTLTGLPSRTLFLDRFETVLRMAERNRDQFFLLYIDLDKFKSINDLHGHDAGDVFLKQVAVRMKNAVRTTDTLCRWGGDEFLALLPQTGDRTEALRIANRLAAAAAEPVDVNGSLCQVTVSIGVASFPENGRTRDRIQKAADAAMYLAKERTNGQVVFTV